MSSPESSTTALTASTELGIPAFAPPPSPGAPPRSEPTSGWHTQPPSLAVPPTATAAALSFSAADVDDAPRYVAPDDFDLPFGQRSKTPPRPTVPDGWAPNELASYIGDSWVPPAFDPTTPFLIAPPLEPAEPTVPNASRTKVLVAALAAAVVLVIGVPRLLNSDTPATTVKAPAAQVADLSQTSVPQTDAEAADLAVRAAARRASQNNFGTDNSSFQGRKGTAEQLAYVSLLEPTSVRLLAPDMLNGVMHTHLSALVSSSALSSAWPATAKSQALLARAIDDQFPLDIWLDPAGNLAKVTIQMADDGTGSQVVLAYS